MHAACTRHNVKAQRVQVQVQCSAVQCSYSVRSQRRSARSCLHGRCAMVRFPRVCVCVCVLRCRQIETDEFHYNFSE